MSKEAIKYFLNRFGELKSVRQTYEPTWLKIMDHMAPDLKGHLVVDKKDDGQRNDELVYDGTPIKHAQTCAAGMWASISSPSRPWMRRKMRDKSMSESKDANVWLDDVTGIDYDIMQESNFYQAMYSVYLHLCTIGTGVIVVDPDFDDVISCRCLNIGEYWLGVNSKGKVDTLFRELEFTASKLVEKFGEEAVPERLKQTIKADNPSGNKYVVVHVIATDTQKIAPFKKEFVSAYFLKDEHKGEFLRVKGYNHKPFAAPRWYTNAGETYGKMSPGRNALGDCMQLQTMVYDFHVALQKVINPPLQGYSGATDDDRIDTSPGAFNPINPVAPTDVTLKPLFAVNPDLQAMWQSIQDKKDQIAKLFYVDLFMAVSMRQDKDMTAEEVRSIAGERMLALGPGLDNLHTELLNELMEIIFNYAIEAGVYPVPPKTLEGKTVKVDYISVLAQAQKMIDISRIDQILKYAQIIAQMDVGVLDKVDLDQTIDEVAQMTGTPSRLIRSDDEVQALRQQRAAQQQAQNMAQAGETIANIADKASNVQFDSDNLASRVLGVMQ